MEPAPSAKDVTKKVRKLIETVEELKSGKQTYFFITRLTSLKSLCKNPEIAARFALHLAERTMEKTESSDCPGHITPKDWQKYRELIATAVRSMRDHCERTAEETLSALRKLLPKVEAVQTFSGEQVWGRPIRTIYSRDVLIIEDAMRCFLHPHASSELAYQIAKDYTEKYNPRYGTGLIPESVPFLEDIVRFWMDYSNAAQDQSIHSSADAHKAAKRSSTSETSPRSGKKSGKLKTVSDSFGEKYPNLSTWVQDGWIEIGYTEGSRSFIRVLNEGGMIWEGKTKYPSVDEALRDAERAIRTWLEKNS